MSATRTIYPTAKIVFTRRLLAAVSFGGRTGTAAADVLGGVNEVSTSYGPPSPNYARRRCRFAPSGHSILLSQSSLSLFFVRASPKIAGATALNHNRLRPSLQLALVKEYSTGATFVSSLFRRGRPFKYDTLE